MGLASMFLGKDNPFSQWVGGHQNFVSTIGSGLMQGQNLQAGLQIAGQYMPQARQLDQAAQEKQKAEALAAKQLDMTKEWLKQNHPDLAMAVEQGLISAPEGFMKAYEMDNAKSNPDIRLDKDGNWIDWSNPSAPKKVDVPGVGGGAGGPAPLYEGTNLEGQNWDHLRTMAPNSYEYAAAYHQLFAPYHEMRDIGGGQMADVKITPEVPEWLPKPTYTGPLNPAAPSAPAPAPGGVQVSDLPPAAPPAGAPAAPAAAAVPPSPGPRIEQPPAAAPQPPDLVAIATGNGTPLLTPDQTLKLPAAATAPAMTSAAAPMQAPRMDTAMLAGQPMDPNAQTFQNTPAGQGADYLSMPVEAPFKVAQAQTPVPAPAPAPPSPAPQPDQQPEQPTGPVELPPELQLPPPDEQGNIVLEGGNTLNTRTGQFKLADGREINISPNVSMTPIDIKSLGVNKQTENQIRLGMLNMGLQYAIPKLSHNYTALAGFGDNFAKVLGVVDFANVGLEKLAQSPEYKLALSSGRSAIRSILYALSGAAATPSEFSGMMEDYLPEVGDPPVVMMQKWQAFLNKAKETAYGSGDPKLMEAAEKLGEAFPYPGGIDPLDPAVIDYMLQNQEDQNKLGAQ